MPSYFYHLKFELYPTAEPLTIEAETEAQSESPAAAPTSEAIWVPESNASIFDDLPSHPRSSVRKFAVLPRSQSYQQTSRVSPIASSSELLPEPSASRSKGVIDCGAPRAPPTTATSGRIERLSERQWLERTRSYPPPTPSAAIKPQTAARDWRFGCVSVESVEPKIDRRRFMNAKNTELQHNGMAGDTSKAGPSAAPTLGPTFGGSGTSTTAEILPLTLKNTELGWGVVHFYREGEETPGIDTTESLEEEESAEDQANLDDFTTLCIPAVPAYMSPGDILGFLGEQWSDDISHCRLVMTSRMNRYLVLLKFRDGRRAKKWRTEFDGKVFNAVEVSCIC
jgi:BRCA1-associated protein